MTTTKPATTRTAQQRLAQREVRAELRPGMERLAARREALLTASGATDCDHGLRPCGQKVSREWLDQLRNYAALVCLRVKFGDISTTTPGDERAITELLHELHYLLSERLRLNPRV